MFHAVRVRIRFPLPSAFTDVERLAGRSRRPTLRLMKAILAVAGTAARLDRAAECGRSSLRPRGSLEGREDDDRDERHGGRDRPVDAAAAPLALPCLLDQRLDEGLELLAVDRIARAGRARRGGDGHGCLPDSVTLVLLASC